MSMERLTKKWKEEYLKLCQQHVIKKVTSIMKNYPSIKYNIKFRNGKRVTAGTIWTDTKTNFKTFIFSNYNIMILLPYELDNLIKHECAHAIIDETGHGEHFVKVCKKLKCSKKWHVRETDVDVYGLLVNKV
jgi:ribulose 1,5-bisphosphate synthetase/thiazole synthase